MAPANDDLISGFLKGDDESSRQIDAWIHEVVRHPKFGLKAEAADLAQDVRRKLLSALRDGRFHGSSTLRTYVWRVAQHVAIDHLRMRRTRPAAVPLDDVAEPLDRDRSPEALMLHAERRALFHLVLARLGDECRDLFHLIVFDERGYAEIARQLGASEGAIKVRALRCREKAMREYKSVTSQRAPRL